MRRDTTTMCLVAACVGAILLVAGAAVAADGASPDTVLIRNATIWTQGPQGKLESADLLAVDGKIVRVGVDLEAPAGAVVVDATGRHVTPGLIDVHSHTAVRGGVNEGSNNITAEVRVDDVIDPDAVDIYRELAGGLTCAHLLHGSANSIGGQDAVIKLRRDATVNELLVGGREGIKFALGENPKRSNMRGRTTTTRYPTTRMGVMESIRMAFIAARNYQRDWQEYEAMTPGEQERREPPRRDLQLEAIGEILDGERTIHCHAYRQDEMLAMMRLAEDFGIRVATFEHGMEGYKIADEVAAHGAGITTSSDWWGYKLEAYDAIPFTGALLNERGVLVTYSSDSSELARRLNLEAAKAVKYGVTDEEEALAFVTINGARQLGLENRIGSLEAGKDADVVLWSGHPLSVYSIVEQTWVDGVREFDRQADLDGRGDVERKRSELIERIRGGDKGGTNTTADQEGEGVGATEGGEPSAVATQAPRSGAAASRPVIYFDRLQSLGGPVSIVGATVHTMVGEPIADGTVSFREGRIVEVGAGLAPLPEATVIDAAGKHLYPGLVDASSVLGLTEISSVAGSVDISETGSVNPALNTAIAVNPDSAVIPVTRANGLTHVLTTPGGGLIRGTSALIRLDGWTWEDMMSATPVAMHVSWPAFRIRTRSFFGPPPSREDQEKDREKKLKKIRQVFEDARAYAKARAAADGGGPELDVDPALEAMLPVLDGTLPVVVHAEDVRQIKSAVEWAEEEGVRLVLAGNGDVWRVADLLAAKGVPVIVSNVLAQPARDDEPYDTPFTTAKKLHDAGVQFCIAGAPNPFAAANTRNLPYHAAMAAAFGLPRDEALRAVTLYPAQILGFDGDLGSIEPGKSASLILTNGDPLEIRTTVERVFIDGRETDLDNMQARLYRRYAGRPKMGE